MEKTLGGDRLGAGKKMKVEMHNYSRSSQNLSYIFRTTMSVGTLVPWMSKICLPGDTWDIDLNLDMKTHPTVGPMFGSEKIQIDIFQAPIRLYQGQLHNNKLGIGLKMSTVKLPVLGILPQVTSVADIDAIAAGEIDVDNLQINPSSILAYLGIRGIGMSVVGLSGAQGREFNGVPFLAYWDIYKNYYANKQEEIGAVIHNGLATPAGNVITDIEIDGVTLGIPALPTALPLNQGTIITILGAAAADDLINAAQIQVQLINGAPGGSIPLRDIGTVININAGVNVTLRYNFNTYGNQTAISWNNLVANQTNNEINVVTFPLENIDIMRERILAHSVNVTPFEIHAQALDPYQLILQVNGTTGFRSILSSQEGLALKTYQSDLFNNWLQTDWIDGTDGISAITAVDTSSGEFTIDTLNLSKKVYDMLNRIAVSGGSYDDWLDAVYTHDRYTKCESPMYMGGLIKELVFQEVVSNSEAAAGEAGGAQPLGTLAGKGVLSGKHKGGHVTIKVDEPSYIIGIVSITPRIDYSQGNQWDVHLKTMDDLHKPALDEIGFQELITEQMAWWDVHEDIAGNFLTKSAGKQPAWINYMTEVNVIRGNFAVANNEMFMVLTRRYEAELDGSGFIKIKDLTTYIDPRKFNFMFAETALDSQNYWCQISADITARRKLSAKLMPNL